MSLWSLIAPNVGSNVELRYGSGHIYGVLSLLRLHADGSAFVEFTSGAHVLIPAIKEPA